MEPEARSLYVVRNKLEHSYLKVHEILVPRIRAIRLFRTCGPIAWLIRSSGKCLKSMTLHVFRLARAALIYLSLGMHREEQRRNKANPKTKTASMRLDVWHDAWKR